MRMSYIDEISNCIQKAELIVIGLGEEWNLSTDMQQSKIYQKVLNDLKEYPEYQWLMSYFYYKWTDDKLQQAYKNLFDLLNGKNYFVVATTTNRSFTSLVRDGRFVMPCGSEECMCDEGLSASTEQIEFLESLEAYSKGKITMEDIQFVRDNSGEIIPFNNIYAPNYKEEGYLPQWSNYMRWLQGTMNRKVCLLELGAGLQFPSVIRFPFEKMTYFNQKATCFRVHKTLYHLTEEMAERSVSVSQNSVDFFADI